MAKRTVRLKSKRHSFRGGAKGRKAADRANREVAEQGYSSTGYRALISSDPPDRDGIPEYTSRTVTPLFVSDPSIADKIYELIQQGNYIGTVCKAVGIHRTTFMQWLRRGFEGVDLAHYDFYMNVRRADGLAEADRVSQIVKHGHHKWQANAWMLERRYPETWGKKETTVNVNNNSEVNITVREELGNQVIQDVESRELVRKLIGRRTGTKP